MRVQPGASRNGIDGLTRLADGRDVLLVRVTAAPEGGKANAALIKLLSKSLRLPKSALAVVAGASGRLKTIEITGDPETLADRLTAWLEALAKR